MFEKGEKSGEGTLRIKSEQKILSGKWKNNKFVFYEWVGWRIVDIGDLISFFCDAKTEVIEDDVAFLVRSDYQVAFRIE